MALMSHKRRHLQARYVEQLAHELALMGTCLVDAAKGRHHLTALSSDERGELAVMAGKLAEMSTRLDVIAADVDEAEGRNAGTPDEG